MGQRKLSIVVGQLVFVCFTNAANGEIVQFFFLNTRKCLSMPLFDAFTKFHAEMMFFLYIQMNS